MKLLVLHVAWRPFVFPGTEKDFWTSGDGLQLNGEKGRAMKYPFTFHERGVKAFCSYIVFSLWESGGFLNR
jgi:hypothetical protein